MSDLAYVDSLNAVEEATRRAPDCTLITDNPLLAHDPATGGRVANIDTLLSLDQSYDLGWQAVDLALAIDERIAESACADEFGLYGPNLRLGGSVSRLVAALLHRGAVLARAIDHFEPSQVSLFVVDTPRWELSVPFLMHRFVSAARVLGEARFFDPAAMTTVPVATQLPTNVNDTRIDDFGRRIAMLPVAVIAAEVAGRLRINAIRPGAPVLPINGDNETLREAVPWLMLAGYKLRRNGRMSAPPAGPRRDLICRRLSTSRC